MYEKHIYDGFVKISQYLGNNTSYVQGGGGNTSAKLQADRMLVKASGLLLKDVTLDKGFANVDYITICKYLQKFEAEEDIFNAQIISSNTVPEFRPSMETGFHAVLGKFVVHSHSVFANVLNCAVEGQSLVRHIFPDAAWIPYASPGKSLTLGVQSLVNSKIFFLGNHGVIVHGRSADAVIEAHEELNNRLCNELQLPNFDQTECDEYGREFMNEHILFPDQVIYTNPDSNFDGSSLQRDIFTAYAYIHSQIDRLHLTPHYLNQKDAAFLLNMDAEKYRAKALD
jgi:rhamnose utilization protein RhaD (predicted bifunctional aldolase and dehydrogenase)